MKLPFNIQPKRTEDQTRALKKAKALYNSDPVKYKDTMFCPYCGSPLIKSGNQHNFQTLSEHITDPNGKASLKDEYICSADSIWNGQYLWGDHVDAQVGCEFGILHAWNGGFEKGGSYVSEYKRKLYKEMDMSLINKRVIGSYMREDSSRKFSAALNTFECQAQTDIYYTGLKRRIYFPPILTLNLIQLTIELSYKANDFGEVIKTYANIGFLKKDNTDTFCIMGHTPLRTWKYLQRSSKFNIKQSKSAENEKDKAIWIADAMNMSVNHAWIYRLHQWYMYIIHPRYVKLLKKYDLYKK